MLLPSQSIFRMFKVLCRVMCNVLTHPTSKYSTYPLSSSLPYYYFPREYLLSEPIMLSKDIGLAFLQHQLSHLLFLLTKSTFSKKVHPFWSTLGPPFNELHQSLTNTISNEDLSCAVEKWLLCLQQSKATIELAQHVEQVLANLYGQTICWFE